MISLKPPLFFIALSFILICQTSMACPRADAFNQAYETKDIARLRAFSKGLKSCAETTEDKYRYLIARRLYDQLFEDKPEALITEGDYREITAIQPKLWAAMADLGDLSMKKKNYKAGLSFYQKAIIDIKGLPQEILAIKRDKDAIPNAYIQTLHDKAENARLLAGLSGEYISPVRDRGKKLDGMHSFSIRGVVVSLHKYPILFAYDKSELDFRKNRENLSLLYETLHNAGDPSIEVIGHTDYKGGNTYNDKLSLQRAKSIRDYLLKDKNYQGEIKAVGKGKREEIKMHSARRKDLTDAQWRQLNRRVETRRIK